jgi:hypothetical protein
MGGSPSVQGAGPSGTGMTGYYAKQLQDKYAQRQARNTSIQERVDRLKSRIAEERSGAPAATPTATVMTPNTVQELFGKEARDAVYGTTAQTPGAPEKTSAYDTFQNLVNLTRKEEKLAQQNKRLSNQRKRLRSKLDELRADNV